MLAWFPDDQACLDYLAELRWPRGFVCPACAATEFWRTGRGLWMCQGCARRTSVTAGTIFHRTRTPLSTWFAATWFVTSQKNGISAQGLQRVLGLKSYETAWAWMHKLRRAMVRPDRDRLTGIVEVDETFVGGFAERMVLPGSTIRTDGARMLRKLADNGYTHEFTNGYNAPNKADVLPGVHLTASLLKRWLTGTLHFAVAEHQLPYYPDEFTFRFNRRDANSRGLLFYRLIEQAANTDPQPLHSLLQPERNPYFS